MAGISFAKVLADCELLRASLPALLEELPHLNAENSELEAFLNEIKSLNQRQSELTSQLREVVRLRQEAEGRGRDLRGRRASQLRGKLGFKNERLLSFGIPPRRKPVRRKEEESPTTKPPETPETPEASKASPAK
jgi:hypothetical protein